MAINARAAARKEAEIAFLKAEDELLKELGKKRKREAAERSAAIKEKDLPGYEPEEPIFYSEEDREEENEYSDFGKEFLKELESEEEEYLSFADRRKQKKSDTVFDTYNTGEEWLMSEGEDDLAKGFINNFRSAVGTGVEDFAYWLNDNAPWYEPAETVFKNNTAGKIEEKAQKQFGNAKEKGVNGEFVDAMDDLSKGLGYNVFGAKAGNYIQSGAESFDEYRALRDSGYTKEEATNRMLINAGFSFAGDKLWDKGGEWVGNRINSNLGYVTNNKPLSAKGWNDKRNQLDKIERRDIIETQAGFACFPEERQNEYAKKIKPEKYIDNGIEKTYFDVAMHGTPQAVGFWSEEMNMSPRFLAEVITHNPKYEKGQKVRLLSCNTGEKIENEYCFAEELANIMGVEVEAPNDIIYMSRKGIEKIGRNNEGGFVSYKPNDRRRLK